MHVFTIEGEERKYELVYFALEDVVRATLAIHFDEIKEETDFRQFLREDTETFITSNESKLKTVNEQLCEIAATMNCSNSKKLPLQELIFGIVGSISTDYWSKMFGKQKQ